MKVFDFGVFAARNHVQFFFFLIKVSSGFLAGMESELLHTSKRENLHIFCLWFGIYVFKIIKCLHSQFYNINIKFSLPFVSFFSGKVARSCRSEVKNETPYCIWQFSKYCLICGVNICLIFICLENYLHEINGMQISEIFRNKKKTGYKLWIGN